MRRASLCSTASPRPARPAGRDRLHRRAGTAAGGGLPLEPSHNRPNAGRRMSNPGDADATPITSLKQLADYLAAGCKPPDAVPHRHRAREVRLPPRRSRPPRPTSRGRHPGRSATARRAAARSAARRSPTHGNMIGLKQGDAPRSRWSPPASSSFPARRARRCTRRGPSSRRISSRCAASSARRSARLRAARLPPDRRRRGRCRGCRRAATRSCAATCRRSARSAST